MAFTTAELENIAAAALDFYIKQKPFAQTIQDKPLLAALTKKQKSFPGGKGKISLPVVFDYTTAIKGYSHLDVVTYDNPHNLKRVEYNWKEIHAGITVSLTELKHDGISVSDSTTGASTSKHSDREMTALTGLLEHKLADMTEGWARSFNEMLWGDGLADPKLITGVTHFITNDPTTGIVGGINRATVSAWRNRAAVGTNKIIADKTNQTLTKFLRAEVRQLTRFGGKPNLIFCGSAALAKLEEEVTEKGAYTQTGFMKEGSTELGMADIHMRGVGKFVYDPTLDALGKSDFIYIIDESNINLYVMDGEDKKTHNPARPHDQYVIYRAMTWTGGMGATQLNGCGVYQVG